tara:strand:- start:2185 stop:2898 length:714 start_codon:yes stop_codon:yes gene_type:complete
MSGRVGSITTDIVSDGLVFNMDAANRASYPKTGTVITDTINSATGTFNGSTFINEDNGIINFDGTDDYIDFDDILDLGILSVNMWINCDVYNSGRQFLFGKWKNSHRSYAIVLNQSATSAGSITSQISTDGGSSNVGLATYTGVINANSTWFNIGMTNDGTNVKTYVNGILGATTSIGGAYTSGTGHVAVGTILFSNDTSPLNPFNGQIANTHVYNRVLSASEVLHNYNALRGRFGL